MHYIKQCLEPGRILNYKESIYNKSKGLDTRKYYGKLQQAGMIELQLTDKCNLNCFHCHFRDKGDKFFEKDWFDIINNDVMPRAISLAGGGEPTLYPNFNEIISILKSGSSKPQIGLISNGVFIPKGEWPRLLSWIRISLYSILDNKYAGLDSSIQNTVIQNILAYMNMDEVKMLGVGLLYYKENIHDCIRLSYELYKLLKTTRRTVHNFNIQFKRAFVLCDPRNLNEATHRENINLIPDRSSISKAIEYIQELSLKEPEYGKFLNVCTNYQQFNHLLSDYLDECMNQTNPDLTKFEEIPKCYAVLDNRLITPDGYVYPCPTVAEHRELSLALGHISCSSEKFAEQLLKYYNCKSEWCNKRFCRHSTHNKLVEDYFNTGHIPSYCSDILQDNFF